MRGAPLGPEYGGDDVEALRAKLARAERQLAEAQHEVLTLKDRAIGAEAALGHLREELEPVRGRELEAALYTVRAARAMRLDVLVRVGPIKRALKLGLGLFARR